MKTYKNPLTIIKGESPQPFVPTPSLVYTLSSDGTYYIVGTGFTTIETIQADEYGGVSGSGLDNTWQGGEINIPAMHNNLPVKGIASLAFQNITNITKFNIQDGEMLVIGRRALTCSNAESNLKEITLPNSLLYLGSSDGRVFVNRQGVEIFNYRCSNLISGGIICFRSVGELTTNGMILNFSKNVQQIPSMVFSNAFYVKEINFEKNSIITNLKTQTTYQMFTKDLNIPTLINLPESLTNIEYNSISGVGGDHSSYIIKILATVPPTLASGGLGSYVTKIYVPAESVEAYKTATNWSVYASVIEAIPE